MSLKGKVAIVTGGSRGIGKAIVLELTRLGASVVINYNNDDESAINTLEEVKSLGGYGILVKGNVSEYNFCNELVTKCLSKFGKIDILVNNAAISKVGLFIDMKEEEFNQLINVNVKSLFNMSKNVIPHMIERGCGNIVNISSMWGNVGASCEVAYSASKGAVNMFTRALAKEVAPMNIRVNAVAPGVIKTKMNSWLSEDELKDLQEEIPMGRLGEPREVAKAVAFLVSQNSSYITGQILNVDGAII
ncbi:SDR family oxidoreductase [Clostridium senegalense]|uniref:elongation factor P 5-aminopentanone reductase n=1 Tax=Clostridium senegalense TaxID=1465809 RepID=UPI001C10A04A|nr:SDR family oxidoreductase [Clostridium senegalense]MBU5225809.1 SDR family oxidoreductase [Clostridium senegalense]